MNKQVASSLSARQNFVDRDITHPLASIFSKVKNYLSIKGVILNKLKSAGIQIDGSQPWDIQVFDERFYTQVFFRQSLGLGESYMKGYWECEDLDQFFHKLFLSKASKRRYTPDILLRYFFTKVLNFQSISRSRIVNEVHYDLDNTLYRNMLDKKMVYTCAYWKNSTSLEKAQTDKLKLICEKLNLEPGMKLLDIGCGFGSLLKFAAENYGVEGVGISLSKEQIKLGKDLCKGLPIEFKLQDYRNHCGTYDRIVSVGMMEAVGAKNYRNYMEVIHNSLAEDGIALIHTVGHNFSTHMTDPWIHRYIFPNGVLPSIKQFGSAIENLFVMEDWHNFGPDYDKTLMEWNRNFEKSWPALKSKYSETFRRMWRFYLLSFAGGFRARNWQLWQVVLTKKGRSQPKCRIY